MRSRTKLLSIAVSALVVALTALVYLVPETSDRQARLEEELKARALATSERLAKISADAWFGFSYRAIESVAVASLKDRELPLRNGVTFTPSDIQMSAMDGVPNVIVTGQLEAMGLSAEVVGNAVLSADVARSDAASGSFLLFEIGFFRLDSVSGTPSALAAKVANVIAAIENAVEVDTAYAWAPFKVPVDDTLGLEVGGSESTRVDPGKAVLHSTQPFSRWSGRFELQGVLVSGDGLWVPAKLQRTKGSQKASNGKAGSLSTSVPAALRATLRAAPAGGAYVWSVRREILNEVVGWYQGLSDKEKTRRLHFEPGGALWRDGGSKVSVKAETKGTFHLNLNRLPSNDGFAFDAVYRLDFPDLPLRYSIDVSAGGIAVTVGQADANLTIKGSTKFTGVAKLLTDPSDPMKNAGALIFTPKCDKAKAKLTFPIKVHVDVGKISGDLELLDVGLQQDLSPFERVFVSPVFAPSPSVVAADKESVLTIQSVPYRFEYSGNLLIAAAGINLKRHTGTPDRIRKKIARVHKELVFSLVETAQNAGARCRPDSNPELLVGDHKFGRNNEIVKLGSLLFEFIKSFTTTAEAIPGELLEGLLGGPDSAAGKTLETVRFILDPALAPVADEIQKGAGELGGGTLPNPLKLPGLPKPPKPPKLPGLPKPLKLPGLPKPNPRPQPRPLDPLDPGGIFR